MPFRSWAAHRIRHAMLDGMRSWGPLPRAMHRQLREFEAAEWQDRARDAQRVASRPAQQADAQLHKRKIRAKIATRGSSSWKRASTSGGSTQPARVVGGV
jgi:hypothetical protein